MAEEILIEDIVFPSEFKINILSIKDEEGASHTYNEWTSEGFTHLNFVIMDNYGGTYIASWDCKYNGQTYDYTFKNCVVEGEGSSAVFYVIVQDYKLKGKLKMKVSVAKSDSAFRDNNWDAWSKPIDIPVNIIV